LVASGGEVRGALAQAQHDAARVVGVHQDGATAPDVAEQGEAGGCAGPPAFGQARAVQGDQRGVRVGRAQRQEQVVLRQGGQVGPGDTSAQRLEVDLLRLAPAKGGPEQDRVVRSVQIIGAGADIAQPVRRRGDVGDPPATRARGALPLAVAILEVQIPTRVQRDARGL
jgi:hypothetical protein